MSWILDLAVILIIAIFTLIGIKRGAIKEIVSLVGVVVALLLAFYISKPASVVVYDKVVGETIYNAVYDAVEENVGADIDSTIDALPEEIIKASDALGVDIKAELEQGVDGNKNLARNVADIINNSLAKPLVVSVIQIVIFIILFIILKVLIGWLGKVLNIVSKLPVIGQANTLVGGIVGAARGIIVALILCYVVIIILNIKPEGVFGINLEDAQNTKLFSFLSGVLR